MNMITSVSGLSYVFKDQVSRSFNLFLKNGLSFFIQVFCISLVKVLFQIHILKIKEIKNSEHSAKNFDAQSLLPSGDKITKNYIKTLIPFQPYIFLQSFLHEYSMYFCQKYSAS